MVRRSQPISHEQIVRITGKIRADLLPKLTAAVARRELAKVMATAPAPYTTIVDGREGAQPEDVKPGGIIVFQFRRIGAVFDWIFTELIARSPVGPPEGGHYRDDHWLFVDGAHIPVPADPRTLVIPKGAELVIADLRLYSRKIEGGPGRPPESIQAPDGVYELTAKDAIKRFPGESIEFTYRGFAEARPLAGKAKNKSINRFPCIVLKDAA